MYYRHIRLHYVLQDVVANKETIALDFETF